jgi:hypothetical protein
LKGDHPRRSGYEVPFALMMRGLVVLCILLISAPALANGLLISGESNTIFRGSKTTDDRKLYPLYEYLRFSGENKAGDAGTISFNIGGWGRADLGDRSTDSRTDGDFQYGYLSYRGNQSNFQLNAGRQFVAEGVATERIDGLYLRSDLMAGFGAAVFAGSPVVTTETGFKGGDILYGARITHSMPKYYTVGLSAVRTDYGGSRIREEEGLDLWLHPFKPLDLVGRSSYNSITSSWMEHNYTLTYNILENLRISAAGSQVNYKDYFFQVTTPALSLTNGLLDPNEKVTTLGGSVEYSPVKFLRLAVEYKNYDYDIAGQAKYYGGKATLPLSESFVAGFSVYRMDGETNRLRFYKYRVFASKKLGKADITLDFLDVNYDDSVDGMKNTYSVTGAIAYAVTENLKVSADINYLKDPYYDNALAGLVKVTYAFDKEFGAEGRAKSEKK